ncbi:MAG: hypothetical protein QOE70_2600 [Chthoniobacter sp.]|jgi:hypothetical protein|nr:hypothetical protein [Chthoniobacter sp.]
MTRFPLLALIPAACVGAGIGFLAGSEKTPTTADETTRLTVNHAPSAASPDPQRTARPIASTVPATTPRTFQTRADAVATLRELRESKDPRAQAREMHALCAVLDAPGVTALLAALEQGMIDSPFDRSLVSNLIGRWAELDPRAAADYAAGLDRRHHFSGIYTVMGIWVESDLAAARQWALSARDREAHLYGVNAVAGFIAETDPRAAFAFLKELPPTEDHWFYVSSIFSRLGKKNPALAAELAPEMPTRALRQSAVRETASAWGEKEPGKALAWYLENRSAQADDWQGEQAVEKLMKKWTLTAPEEAAAFAGALPPGQSRMTLIGKLGQSWGAVDPEAAAHWLQSLPKSSESYRAFDSLIGSWTASDPARAGSFILSQPADRSRDWLLNTLGSNWAESDPAAALAWAREQSDPAIERQVAAEALGAMAAKDLANAGSYFSQLKSPGAQSRAVEVVSNQITRREPERAANWVMEMAAARQPIGRAIEWPVTSWTWRDPEAVGAWLNQQAASATKDAAIGSHAEALAQRNAPAAAAWTVTIGDDALRRKRTKEVITTWAGKDRTAARTWVQQQPSLAAPERQELLETLDPQGRK